MSKKIKAPFTASQVEKLNKYQRSGQLHEFTCHGKPLIPNKTTPRIELSRELCPKGGVLIATEDGWVCPCGSFTQDWAHAFMAEE